MGLLSLDNAGTMGGASGEAGGSCPPRAHALLPPAAPPQLHSNHLPSAPLVFMLKVTEQSPIWMIEQSQGCSASRFYKRNDVLE